MANSAAWRKSPRTTEFSWCWPGYHLDFCIAYKATTMEIDKISHYLHKNSANCLFSLGFVCFGWHFTNVLSFYHAVCEESIFFSRNYASMQTVF